MMTDLADAMFPDAVASYSSAQNFIAGFDALGTIVWWLKASKKLNFLMSVRTGKLLRNTALDPSGCQIRVIDYGDRLR